MLSNDLLSQLNQLKQDIIDNKDIAQGTVRGTSGRYGFVVLDDGRDAFLNPDQMERVFPGDRVEVLVTQNEKEQFEATLEKLLSSSLSHLSGRYRVRGKGHFIATDIHGFSRWIFIPPKDRAKCEDGHYATAKITRHPFKDGRAQAKITQNIGDENTKNIERAYTIGKYQLEDHFTQPITEQVEALLKQPIAADSQRQDLQHLPFITIDSAATRDMDDALTIETTEGGWLLCIAIADPGAEIALGSPLDKTSQQRTQTTYFPGKPLTMLPENLSLERYSLFPEQERLSLVCQCNINHNGEVLDYTFVSAVIQSHAKLSYSQVAALLDDRSFDTPDQLSNIEPFSQQITALQACASALNNYRQQQHIVIENKPDFALYLNADGKLDSIEKIERNSAHILVEEAMLLANRCAGEYLAQHQCGLYVHHRGYREERREDIETLMTEKLSEGQTEKVTIQSTDQLTNYVELIKQLQSDEKHQPLLSIQQRFLEASKLSLEPKPHFGLGFEYYATVTSPIRRYQDLYNQRLIHQLLEKQTPTLIDENTLDTIQENLSNSRNASRFMEQWLVCDYMKGKIGEEFIGSISLLTNQGIGIRLVDTGIEGFVAAKRPDRKNKEKTGDKISFNNQRMELVWNETPLFLDQEVKVTLKSIDHEKKKFEFSWVEKI